MKKLYAFVSVLFLYLVSFNSFAQVSTNGASGMLPAYGSLAGALSDLNAIGTVTAKVVITLQGNETAPVGGYVITATGTATDSIVIDGVTFTITAPVQGAGSTNDAVIKIVGSDYIAIRNFVIQEQTTTVVLAPVANNTMTEFGIALYGASTVNGAQNNTIQDNTITLNSTYLTSFGILSTCTFVSAVTTLGAAPAAQTATAGAENSNNKYYGNNISNVAFGIMIVAPTATATVKQTGDDIGGTSAATGNTISYGNTSGIVAVSYPNAQNVAATMGGITITNAVGASVRFNTVTTAPTFTIATAGIILGWTTASPANSTFTNTISDNNVTLTTSATAVTAYGIEFGYGNGASSTATLTAANNTVTISQATIAATTATLSAIRVPYSALATIATGNIITINQTHTFNGGLGGAVNGIIASAASVVIPALTITGNNITFNQSLQNTTANSLTSSITGILAGANLNNITTANVNFNNITIKQAVTSTGTFGAGTANYISFVGALGNLAAFTTLNVNSNNLNTLGSTIRYTGTVAGISHDFTNPATLSISNNIINFDRTVVGVTYGTFASAYTAAAITTTTISGNNINFSGSMTGNPTNVVGHNDFSGNTTMVKNITLDTVIMNLPNVTAGNQIGVIFQTGATAALGTTTTGSIANCIVTITSGGGTISGVEVRGTGIGILTNINGNTLNLSSSNNAPTITGVNILGGTRSRVFNNNFNSLAAPNSATGAPNIRSVWLQQGGANSSFYNEVFGNTVSNVFTFAGTGSAIIDGITIGAASTYTNVYKNKIYGLTASTSGAATLVTGIRQNTPAAGGITNINNNYIGFDNSANPNASNIDAVRGIAFVTATAASTHNVFHNTIYLAAAPSATVTNYGTTGIFQQNSPTPANASLVLRNNIIVNNSTAKGTGRVVAFRRNAVFGATHNYNPASNNNLFYAGTPGAANVIFFESGTSTSAITLSAYQALANLSPRDNASVSELPPFLSTLGSNINFLHINPAIGTVVESSGGLGTGITDDYDTDVRCPGGGCPGGSTRPDIGADELAGTCPVPVAPTALILTGAGPYTGNFTGAIPSPTGGYLVVRSTVNTQPVPVNGVNYFPPAGTPVPGLGTPFSVIATTGTTFVDNPGAGTFYYWVFSYNTGCGTSPNYSTTTTSSVTTPCVAPPQPTVLNLTSVSSSNITGTFTASAASGYYVIRTTTGAAPVPAPVSGTPYVSSGTGTLVSSGPSTSFSATGLSGSTTYYFYVYAYNDACVGSPTYNLVLPLTNNIATQPCLLPGTYTVGPGGNYTSVGAVMTALSCFTFAPLVPTIGAFFFEFLPTYNSSVETFPLVISPVYNPAAHLITFRPQTGATGISITSGNTAGTLLFQGIALNQAPTYFVFDGRPGGLGVAKELTIQNTNLGSSYAIQFENGANNNTIQHCKIRSAHNGTSGGGGTINFASSNSTAGNSTNTITNNDIYNATAGTPTNAIYSNGLSTAPNNSNVISNNNIYDHFNATYTTAGINLAAYSSSWIISGNSFYQTSGRTFTSTTATYNSILAAATTVGGLTITDNFIGGTAASAAGGFMTVAGNGILRAIQLTTGTTATSVQNNTITNIAFTSSNSSSAQSLISLVAGVINVGTVTGNTIGSQATTNRITVSLSDNTAGVNFAGISASSTVGTDVFDIRNNTIGGIGVSGTSTSAAIQGINFSGATGVNTIRANIIGSVTVANSFSNSLNTTLTGIVGNSSNTTPTQIISGNTIVNLSATNIGTNSYVTGISVAGLGRYAVGNTANAGNLIYNLSSAGSNSINYNATGIAHAATTAGQSIFGNTIRNITSTSVSADAGVIGIYYNGAAGAGNTIESNNIHSLDLASTNVNSIITGIQAQGGAASYYNNMIRLGITNTGTSIASAYGIYGITENSGTNLFYMNSVYVGGSGVGAGSDSYAFFGANTTTQDIRNNIFWNARSNISAAVPNHYAVTLSVNTGTIDYNDLVATGTNGKVLGYFGSQLLTLASWRTATSRDANSYSSLPGFISPTLGTPDLHINIAANTVAEAGGTAVGPATDIDAAARAGLTPVDLGADAFISSVAPVSIDGSITALTAPASGFACFTNSEAITVTFRNNGTSAINFASTPVTITVNVSGATVTSASVLINSGSLAAGASQNYVLAPTFNMTFVGTYFFNCTFSVASPGVDRDITNDEFTTSRTVAALASGTISANPAVFCGVASGTPTITLTGASGGTIQWYEATAIGGPYTAVGTNSANYTPSTPISVTHYYRATISCIASGFSATSDTVPVVVSSPVLNSTSPNQTSCGPSSFTFTASVSGSASTAARWYDASTGALAYTGTPFVTPLLSSTTAYSVRAVDTTSTPVSATFGTGTSVNSITGYASPYTNWYGGTKHQMLILASELTAAGVTAGDITSVSFYISSVGSEFSGSLNDFSIYMGSTSAAFLTTTFLPVSSFPAYFNASQPIPSSGIVTHNFSTAFSWNGTSNIIVQTAYNNGNVGNSADNVQMYYTPTSFNSTNFYVQDGTNIATILAATTANGGAASSPPAPPTVNRPNMTLGYLPFCSSAPTTVTATVNPGPTAVSLLSTTGSVTNSAADTITICTDSAKLVVSGGTTTQNSSVTVSSGTINLAIVDPISGVPSNLTNGVGVTMPLGATIDSIRVRVNLTHTFDGDLNIHLRSPNTQVVNLINQRGFGGDNMVNTQISSNTANASMATGTPPYSNALFRADLATLTTTVPATTTNTFSSLFVTGTGAAQTWTISVHDMFGADIGIFQDWSITIFYQEIIPVPYLWSTTTPNTVWTNSGLSSPYTNQNINTVFIKPTADTNYIIAATLGSCTRRDTVHVKVFNISTAPASLNATPSTSCTGSNVTLTQTGGILGTGATWKWYTDAGFTTPAGGITGVGAAATATVAPLVTTTYYLRSEGGTAPCGATVVSPGSVTVTIDLVNTSWLGVNTNWNDVVNWCSGVIPTGTTNVTIPGSLSNYPVIVTNGAGTALCQNITIAAGATVTTTGVGTLNAKGTFTNNGTLYNWGEIILSGSTAQTFPGAGGIVVAMTRLLINNTSGANPAVSINQDLLIREAITPTLGIVNLNNVYITLRSVSDTTARVGQVGGSFTYTGIGNFVVERYFPGSRTWRLLTAPVVKAFSKSIFNSWQAGGNNSISGNATYVTGPFANPAINGLDVSPLNNYSVKRFDYTNSSWPGIANTKLASIGLPAGGSATYTTDTTGYFVFVRGDRTAANLQPFNAFVIGNITVLRDTGAVKAGSFTYNCNPGIGSHIFTLIGNPYASAVDFTQLSRSATVPNKFQAWDPTIGSVGAWVARDVALNSNTPLSTNVSNIIQSKQAIIVEATGAVPAPTVTFGETAKSSFTGASLLFRPAPSPAASLDASLFFVKPDGSEQLSDGVLVQFNNNYSAGSDYMDALKFTNVNETFCVKDGTNYFIQNRRPFFHADDTLFFSLTRTRLFKYKFKMSINGIMPEGNRVAYLNDKYLHTAVPLKMAGDTWIDFEVTNNAGSSVADRFFITFKKACKINSIKAEAFYSDVFLNWSVGNAVVINHYEVERSSDGKLFTKVGEVVAGNDKEALTNYDLTDPSLAAGYYYYRVKAVGSDYSVFDYSETVKVKVVKSGTNMYVYPNPVTEGIIGLRMTQSLTEGKYTVRLIDESGKAVTVQQVQHYKATATELIRYPSYLAGGTYQLEVLGPDKFKTLINIVIQKQ